MTEEEREQLLAQWSAEQVATAPPGLARRALDTCAPLIAADLTALALEEHRSRSTAA